MHRKLLAAVLPVLVLVMVAQPAGATVVYAKPFALYPPNLCGVGVAQGNSMSSTVVWVQSETRSNSAGSDGVCDNPAPWSHNGLRVRSRLEKLTSNGWQACSYGLQGALPAGHSSIDMFDELPWCGSGTDRIGAHHEIRYQSWTSTVLVSNTFTK